MSAARKGMMLLCWCWLVIANACLGHTPKKPVSTYPIDRLTTPSSVAAGVPKEKLDHVYDWRWRRIQKTVSGWNGSSWTNAYQHKFIYDGWNLTCVFSADLSPLTSFTWGNDASGTPQGAGGVGGLLAMIVHQGTNAGIYFCCFDDGHKVVALLNTNGQMVAEYEYGPFHVLFR